MKKLDPITIEILWSRLISIIDEADITVMKTAFSSIIRDSHDYSCALFDRHGRLLVQATFTSPGHIGGMTICVRKITDIFPKGTLKPGDSLITNDPWLLAGHLPDIMVLTPVFYREKLVAFSGSVFHHSDIGGTIGGGNREVYEEGLNIPLCKLYNGGEQNQDIFNIIRANVRMSDRVIGDLRSQVAANHIVSSKLTEFLNELGWEDLDDLAEEIYSRTETSLRASIEKIPDGVYRNEDYVERPDTDEPISIKLALEVKGSDIIADFEGTSPQVNVGINCVYNYTFAYVYYSIKSVADPFIPNNDGSVRPMMVKAPEGSILNARFPAAVCARTSLGMLIPDIIYFALAKAIPEKVIAQSGSAPLWWLAFEGMRKDGTEFLVAPFFTGGQGANHAGDGVSCITFPANIKNNPVEITEGDSPLVCEKKEFRIDSGGPGKFRGGLGQELVFRVREGQIDPGKPVVESLIGGRTKYAARGLFGGLEGKKGEIYFNDRRIGWGKHHLMKSGDIVTYRTPGGGGFYSPMERDVDQVLSDVRNGLVSDESAKRDYGIIISDKRIEIDR